MPLGHSTIGERAIGSLPDVVVSGGYICSLALLRSINRVSSIVSLAMSRSIILVYATSLALKRSVKSSGIVAALPIKRSKLNLAGYNVYYREVGDTTWILAGFVNASSDPLSITLPSLPDGEYEVRFGLVGFHWDEHLYNKIAKFKIDSSLPTTNHLPNIDGLTASQILDTVQLRWSWSRSLGTTTPYTFGIWTSVSTPVSTAGAPVASIRAGSPGNYFATIAQSVAFYVAVAARDSSNVVGVSTEIFVPAPGTDPDSPPNQYAYHKELPAKDD